MSGAYGPGWGLAGDLMVQLAAGRFPFVVELKRREGWCLDNLWCLSGDPVSWMAAVQGEATAQGAHPMLILKRSRFPVYVGMPRPVVDLLGGARYRAGWPRRLDVVDWSFVELADLVLVPGAVILDLEGP